MSMNSDTPIDTWLFFTTQLSSLQKCAVRMLGLRLSVPAHNEDSAMSLRLCGWFLFLMMIAPGVAAAQNLLSNGDFDTDGSGWTPNGNGTSTYDAAAGSPNVGSMLLSVNDPSGNGVTQAVQQCIAADPSVSYTIGGRGLLDSAATTSAGSGTFVLGQFFASYDCSGVPAASVIANTTGSAAGTPAAFTTYSSTTTSPATAHSFRLTAQVQTGGPGIAQGWVDHLQLTSPEVIFSNGFE